MTNLIYSIMTLLVTNVSTADNATYEQLFEPCPEGRIGCLVIHGQHNGRKLTEATQQTTTYSVVREERLYARFCEACEEMQAKTVTPLTNWSVASRLDSKWVPVATNAQMRSIQWGINTFTNSVLIWPGAGPFVTNYPFGMNAKQYSDFISIPAVSNYYESLFKLAHEQTP